MEQGDGLEAVDFGAVVCCLAVQDSMSVEVGEARGAFLSWLSELPFCVGQRLQQAFDDATFGSSALRSCDDIVDISSKQVVPAAFMPDAVALRKKDRY